MNINIQSIRWAIDEAYGVALEKVKDNQKWLEKLNAAYVYVLAQDEFEVYDGIVLMESDHSDDVYTATATSCNCKAGQKNVMCKHRVRAKLLLNALQIADDNPRVITPDVKVWTQEEKDKANREMMELFV